VGPETSLKQQRFPSAAVSDSDSGATHDRNEVSGFRSVPKTTFMPDTQAAIKEAFERPQWYLEKTAYNIKIRVESIKEFVQGLHPGNVLDIGCGDGSLSLPLLGPTCRITLLDRSRRMLEIASSRVPKEFLEQVEVVNEDFMVANLMRQPFDLIICVGVMAYVEDRRRFVEKMVSVLKPGGSVIAECTDGSHIFSRYSRLYGAVRRGLFGGEFRTVARPRSELVKVFSDLGFEMSASFSYSLPLPGFRRMIPQGLRYRAIRSLYGNVARNRRSWLGNECLFRFNHLPGAVR
jgi:2-polyprenyl-3-methyl-5-hydroxy-6-metoxy-1,4-benzoquinol methylase